MCEKLDFFLANRKLAVTQKRVAQALALAKVYQAFVKSHVLDYAPDQHIFQFVICFNFYTWLSGFAMAHDQNKTKPETNLKIQV